MRPGERHCLGSGTAVPPAFWAEKLAVWLHFAFSRSHKGIKWGSVMQPPRGAAGTSAHGVPNPTQAVDELSRRGEKRTRAPRAPAGTPCPGCVLMLCRSRRISTSSERCLLAYLCLSVSMTMRATFSPLCLQAHTQLTRVHTQPGSAHKDVLTYVHVRPAHTCMHRASSLCLPFPFEGRFPGLQALLASPKQQ